MQTCRNLVALFRSCVKVRIHGVEYNNKIHEYRMGVRLINIQLVCQDNFLKKRTDGGIEK